MAHSPCVCPWCSGSRGALTPQTLPRPAPAAIPLPGHLGELPSVSVSPLCSETPPPPGRHLPVPNDQYSQGGRPWASAGGQDQAPRTHEGACCRVSESKGTCPLATEHFAGSSRRSRPSRWTLPPGSLPHVPGTAWASTPRQARGRASSGVPSPPSSLAPSGLPVTGSVTLWIVTTLSRPVSLPPHPGRRTA